MIDLRSLGRSVGIGVSPSTGTQEALQWLMMGRLAVLFAVLLGFIVAQVSQVITLAPFHCITGYSLLVVGFIATLLQSLALEKVVIPRWLTALHIGLDALLTSVWLLISGAGSNVVALIFIVQIIFVALTLYRQGALLSALTASVCLAIVVAINPDAFSGRWLSWGIYSLVFWILGFVAGFLSEELNRTTQSLREKQIKMERLTALHERIISNLPTGLLTVDHTMRINFANSAAAHILGRDVDELLGKELALVANGLIPFFEKLSGSHAKLQQRVELGAGRAQQILRGDVAELGAEAGLGSLLDKEASGARVLLFQDVTKLSQLEDRVKQHEKLAAVGQLAAGIAHEIRNPLASMSASLEMLRASLPVEVVRDENRKLMEIALREIDRLNRLISEFLDFVKPDQFKFENVALPTVWSEVTLSARHTKEFREDLKLIEEFGEALAYANSSKIKQVMWNLLMNAMQATPSTGTIRVGCDRPNRQWVRLWVEDTGIGMNDEIKAHLFEPFFTTKERGTGLGLATAYKIVEALHGEIRVQSERGKGARFEVWLPGA